MPLLINGQAIDDAALDYEFANIKAHYERMGNVSCCERDPEFRGYARQNIVGRVLLAQEAKRRLPETDPAEVETALRELMEQHGGEARFLATIGASADQLDIVRRDLESELRVRRMVDGACAAEGEPTEADLRRFYEEHLEQFMTAEEVRASHIMKASSQSEKRRQMYDELREVRRKLLAGEEFDSLAREHSDKAQDHIDLGFFKRGELAEEFELVAFSMEIGETSPVFATPFGLHLIRLTDRKPATPRPFDEVRSEAADLFREDRRRQIAQGVVDRLRAEAVIEEISATEEVAVPPG